MMEWKCICYVKHDNQMSLHKDDIKVIKEIQKILLKKKSDCNKIEIEKQKIERRQTNKLQREIT
jgi:hypothetical protein